MNQEYTQVLMEYDVNGEVASVYDYGVQRNSYTNQRSDASQTQYYVYDGRGSVSALTSIYGNAVVSYQYDAYGSARVNGDTYSPYQYNAEAVDWNTGLQYLRARYYNSNIGGFLTQDTYLGMLEDPLTLNLYTYTGNNPVNLMDPSGRGWISDSAKKIKQAIDEGVDTIKKTAKALWDGIKDVVDKAKETVTEFFDNVSEFVTGGSKNNSSVTGGGSGGSRTGATGSYNSSGQSGGGYTDPFTEYLANQSDDTPPVDPVTQSLQNRYGGASVTNVTSSYAYVDNKLVTAMSDNEHKMCLDAKNANDKIQSPEVKIAKCLQVIDSYFKGLGDALFNSISPFKVDTSTGKYQNAYDSGSKLGDTIAILSLLWSVAGGGGLTAPKAPVVAGGSGGSVAVAIDGSAVSGLYGASGFSDVEDEIKKLQEGIKKSEKEDSGGKNKGGSKTKVEVPKSVERQVKKLSPKAKKGYDKAVDALKNGKYSRAE